MSASRAAVAPDSVPTIAERVSALDWQRIEHELDDRGWALTGSLLDRTECDALTVAYDDLDRYRSRIVMAKHNFGLGEYKYFAYPLPGVVERLRREIYPRLAAVADRWSQAMNLELRYPKTLAGMLKRCHAAGQRRPTPLMLRYGKGDYNCLHQDLYGEVQFPLQLAVLLSRPGEDFAGGELVLTEQRPRMQSRAHVVPLAQGDAVIFAVNQRPVRGKRGYFRVTMRHGVSALRSGSRHTLGVIFHDAS